ncbi:unnamed protein product, partial [Ectocarpus sp. 8 AP-2014]
MLTIGNFSVDAPEEMTRMVQPFPHEIVGNISRTTTSMDKQISAVQAQRRAGRRHEACCPTQRLPYISSWNHAGNLSATHRQQAGNIGGSTDCVSRRSDFHDEA